MPTYEHIKIADDNSFPGRGGTALTNRINTLTANKLEALAVGTVTTGAEGTNASVSITGTAPSQSISFTIPRGSKGDAGNPGAPGERGPAALDNGIRHSSKSYVIPAGGEVSIDNDDIPSSGSIFMAIDGNSPMPIWVQIYRSGTYNSCKLITPQASAAWITGDTAQPATGVWKIWVEGNLPGASLKLSTSAAYGRRVRFFWYDLFAGAGNMGGANQGVTITGMVPTSTSLPATHNSGDAYLANDTGMLHISNGTTWSAGVPIRGPIGEQGPAGPQGDQGIQGLKGDKGDQGNPGTAGTTPTVGVGTVTTGAAGSTVQVTNGGTATARTFNFTIPRGDQGIQGIQGNPGTSATITSASASALAAGATPTVTLGGSDTARTFAFGIPAGPKGDTGNAGPANVLSIGTVTTGAAGSNAAVSVSGTSPTQSLSFTIPRGEQGIQGVKGDTGNQGIQGVPGTTPTVGVGTVATGAAGSTVQVTNGGTATARTFNFTIPRGDQGIQGIQGIPGTTPTVGVGTVTTGAAGSSVAVTEGGTSTARTFNFTIPRGDQGIQGVAGTTPTVGVGTVTTGAAGSTVQVSNGGTATARTFNFTIPRGDQGIQGIQGLKGDKGDKGDTGNTGAPGRGITSIADTDGDGTATVTYTDATTSSLVLPGAGPEANPVIKYFLDAIRNRNVTPVKIVVDGSSTANGGVVSQPWHKLVDRLSAWTTKNPVRNDLTDATATDIQWYETADGGTQANTYITAADITGLGSVKPQLMIHMIGSNDYYSQKDPNLYQSQLRTVLADIKAVSPNTRHVFVVHQPRNDRDSVAATYKSWQYTEKLWGLAAENPGFVTVADFGKKYERIGIPGVDVWGLVTTDQMHLADEGNRLLSEWILEWFGIPVASPTAQRGNTTSNLITSGNHSGPIDVTTIAIPAAPFPRYGRISANLFVRQETDPTVVNNVVTPGTPTMEFGIYPIGATANSVLIHRYFHRVPVIGKGYSQSFPVVADFNIPPHTAAEFAVRYNSGASLYISGSSSYTRAYWEATPI